MFNKQLKRQNQGKQKKHAFSNRRKIAISRSR